MIQFNTANQSFRQVMGNSLKYTVPRFQRDYSWQEEQWEDLWEDVIELSKEKIPSHYLGYLVLQSSDNINFTVIDGQQRLATISILILAGLFELKELIKNKVDPDKNQERIDTFRNNFIGFKDPVYLSIEHKLKLNRNNDSHFRTYLCELIQPPVRNINYSERLMGKALCYFQTQLKNHFDNHLTGKKIASLIEVLSNGLFFTTITVSNDTNAYTIFETLNARGVHLSTPDLVKNYIFSLIDSKGDRHDNFLQIWEDKWSNITWQLGKHKFSDFIRVDWNSRYDFSRKKDLFKKIKSRVSSAQSAQQYIENMQENAPVYSALRNETDDFWKQYKNGQYNDKELQLSLKMLNMFNIVAPLSALLAGFHRLNANDFRKFLFYIEVISVRYNIIGNKSPGPQEKAYCATARSINPTGFMQGAALGDSPISRVDKKLKISNHTSQTGSLSSALKELKKIYPSDKEFLNAFEMKTLKTKQTHAKARFLLCRLERHLSNGANINYDEATLEHILPQNPSEEWDKELEEDDKVEELVSYIGNMTLLSYKQNQSLGRNSFAEKQKIFQQSQFKITQQCGEYKQWNKDSILHRQKWLGEQAVALWRLPN